MSTNSKLVTFDCRTMPDDVDEISDRDSPKVLYSEASNSLSQSVEKGEVSREEAMYIDTLCDAYDEETPSVPKPDGESHRTYQTLRAWKNRLRIVAKRTEVDLTEATADDLNKFWDSIMQGTHPDVKDSGLSQNTVTSQQSTVRVFYEYHDDLGIEVEDLSVIAPDKTTVDERQIFTGEEIDKMREVITHPRDRCLFDLFVYTGQRLRAVQTLRIKDIDLDSGEFHLNTDEAGLKGADGKRPLLLAEASVRDWINKGHPNPDDGEAYLICHRDDYRSDTDAHDPLSQRSIRRVLKNIVNEAGLDKPANPHNFRHSFVTIAKRRYDMEDIHIKGLIGHKLKSRVMEETYAHLKDEDHVQAAKEATGLSEPEDDSPFSPEACPNCSEPLPENAKACPACGITMTPDAKVVKDQVEEDIYEGKGAAEDDDEEAAVDALKELVEDNPQKVIELLED